MKEVHYRRQHYFAKASCGKPSSELDKTNCVTTFRMTTCLECLTVVATRMLAEVAEINKIILFQAAKNSKHLLLFCPTCNYRADEEGMKMHLEAKLLPEWLARQRLETMKRAAIQRRSEVGAEGLAGDEEVSEVP